MLYILKTGTEVSKYQISAAFDVGLAVLWHQNAEGRTASALMLDGAHYDTRGECYSIWDECWTTLPTSLAQCYTLARL